jgi:hypothetical protein
LHYEFDIHHPKEQDIRDIARACNGKAKAIYNLNIRF